jgi:APA family basic amino acid/polyamine antiporter
MSLCAPRVPYAMALDGLFPKIFAAIHPRTRVPTVAIIFQGAWASLLALSGTFEQLTTYTIFGLWIFHGVTASSVFVLRRKYPAMERPYKAFGYPMVPLTFVILAILLVSNTLRTNPLEAGAGLVLIVLGVPVFCYFRFWNKASVRFRPS